MTDAEASTVTSSTGEGELPRRFLRPLLLLALEHNGQSYGYELCETVRSRRLAVDLASVYRDLRAMEKHDLVTSFWEPSESGPDRRVYSLTVTGLDAAAAAARDLAGIRDRLSAALASFAREPAAAGETT